MGRVELNYIVDLEDVSACDDCWYAKFYEMEKIPEGFLTKVEFVCLECMEIANDEKIEDYFNRLGIE